MKKKVILGASIGSCVHVAGVAHFLNLAADMGHQTIFAGPALGPAEVIALVRRHQPDMVSLGYRLTPENVVPVIEAIKMEAAGLEKQPVWVFGGTGPVAAVVARLGFFDKVFDSTEDIDDCIAYLRGQGRKKQQGAPAQTLLERMAQKKPYPLLRHHFGLPNYEDTVAGVGAIAAAGVLDVISLGVDQNTQQFFFHPEKRDAAMDGAGGVPVHTEAEFARLKEASQRGSYPLMRCYSGTADVLPMAEVLHRTLNNAWCAVPLFWYNDVDGRGTRTLEQSMADAHALIRWHAKQGLPVEVNEPHHWGLRDAHDVISVAAAYLSAYHAKMLGVRHYIAQYMFNIPGSISFSMDLAKVLAQIEMAESLEEEGFCCIRETRAGLPFLSGDLQLAKGQLAASTQLQMAVKPDIIHVVGYSEAEHAATPEVVVESTKIVRGVIRSCLGGSPNAAEDRAVQRRKRQLVEEAGLLLNFIQESYSAVSANPLFDVAVLADCVRRGILDAPHIVKNKVYRGLLQTRMVSGCCVAWDGEGQRPLTEAERLEQLRRAGRLDALPLLQKV